MASIQGFLKKLRVMASISKDALRGFPELIAAFFSIAKRNDALVIVAPESRVPYISLDNRYINYSNNACIFVCNYEKSTGKLLLNTLYILKRMKWNRVAILRSDSVPLKGDEYSLLWNNMFEISNNVEIRRRILVVSDVTGSSNTGISEPISLPIIRSNSYNNLKLDLKKSKDSEFSTCFVGGIPADIKLISDLSVDLDDPWQESETSSIKDFIHKRRLVRVLIIKKLVSELGKRFGLYGQGWLYHTNLSSDHDLKFNRESRAILYQSSRTCLDLLSQNSNTPIYQRSIEILSYGGLLIQRSTPESEECFGSEYAQLFCFKNEIELFNILEFAEQMSEKEIVHFKKQALRNAKLYQISINNKCRSHLFKRNNN